MNTDAKLDIQTPTGEIQFASIRGIGVDNYDEDGKVYKAVQLVSKKGAKSIRAQVLEFWEENKDKKMPDHPKNWKNITWENGDGDECVSAETITYFEDEDTGDKTPVEIGIVDGELNKLDPDIYSKIGKGSTGKLAIRLKCYSTDKGKHGGGQRCGIARDNAAGHGSSG